MIYRFSQLALVCCVLALMPTGKAHAKDTVIAVLDGEEFTQKQFLPKKSKKKVRLKLALNRFRPTAERKLIELRLPECQVDATEDQITNYFRWWETGLMAARAVYAPKASSNATDRNEVQGIDQMIELLRKRDERPVKVAKDEIERWLAYTCIQSRYGGDAFFVPMGSFDVMAASQSKDNPSFLSAKNGVLMPYAGRLPEPIRSIGQFFQAAEKDGQLSIPDPERHDYFFGRYLGDQYATKTAAEVQQEHKQPYWQ